MEDVQVIQDYFPEDKVIVGEEALLEKLAEMRETQPRKRSGRCILGERNNRQGIIRAINIIKGS